MRVKKKSPLTYYTGLEEIKQDEKGPVNIKVFIYCLIATFILYALIVAVEKAIVSSDEKKPVYVAAMDIKESLLITEDNFDKYFKLEERIIDTLPDGYITDKNMLIGYITDRELLAKEIAVTDIFVKEQNLIATIDNPVEVSLNASNLAQVVGGVLRTGDFINIWSVKTINKNGVQTIEAVPIYEGAYVTRAFTSSGEEISRDNQEEASTMVINIVIPAEQEEAFNKAIAEGTIRLGRVYDTVLSELEDNDTHNK